MLLIIAIGEGNSISVAHNTYRRGKFISIAHAVIGEGNLFWFSFFIKLCEIHVMVHVVVAEKYFDANAKQYITLL